MIKKIIHIVLVIILVIATKGINFTKHYCDGEIVYVSLSLKHQACCADGDNNCCKITIENIKLVNDYLISQINSHIVVLSINTLTTSSDFKPSIINQLYSNFDFPPPRSITVILARLQTYLL